MGASNLYRRHLRRDHRERDPASVRAGERDTSALTAYSNSAFFEDRLRTTRTAGFLAGDGANRSSS